MTVITNAMETKSKKLPTWSQNWLLFCNKVFSDQLSCSKQLEHLNSILKKKKKTVCKLIKTTLSNLWVNFLGVGSQVFANIFKL